MRTFVVSTVEGLNQCYEMLREDARIHNKPYLYHVGFSIQHVTFDRFPEKFQSVTGQMKVRVAICILQFCSKNVSLFVDVSNFPFLPRCLVDIISGHNWIKTGIAVDVNLSYCYENYQLTGLPCFLDLRTWGFLSGVEHPTLENMISKYLGQEYKTMDYKVSNWAQPFQQEDLFYLLEEVYYSFILGTMYIPYGNRQHYPVERLEYTEFFYDNTPEDYITRLCELCTKWNVPGPDFRIETYGNKFYARNCLFNGGVYESREGFNSSISAKQHIASIMIYRFWH